MGSVLDLAFTNMSVSIGFQCSLAYVGGSNHRPIVLDLSRNKLRRNLELVKFENIVQFGVNMKRVKDDAMVDLNAVGFTPKTWWDKDLERLYRLLVAKRREANLTVKCSSFVKSAQLGTPPQSMVMERVSIKQEFSSFAQHSTFPHTTLHHSHQQTSFTHQQRPPTRHLHHHTHHHQQQSQQYQQQQNSHQHQLHTLFSRYGAAVGIGVGLNFGMEAVDRVAASAFLADNNNACKYSNSRDSDKLNLTPSPIFTDYDENSLSSDEHVLAPLVCSSAQTSRPCLTWACKACKKKNVSVDRRKAATLRERRRLRK
ncbi:PREDICTED: polyadenylate-binding protein 1-B, partial [Rhagoletis zephyria]|uniref:polyadenylate-binding protein 1-B n=1 Tax=Rhagoletis zephyria TaxID=28612 RepID=UPI000811283F